MRYSLQEVLDRVDRQIQERLKQPPAGQDRRQKQIPLPEGMEDRRKGIERRKSRQGVREKEKEDD